MAKDNIMDIRWCPGFFEARTVGMLVGSREVANAVAERKNWPSNDRSEFWGPVLTKMLVKSKFMMDHNDMLVLYHNINYEFSTLFFALSKSYDWTLEPEDWRGLSDEAVLDFPPKKWRVAVADTVVRATEYLDSEEVQRLKEGEIVEQVAPASVIERGLIRVKIRHPSSPQFPNPIGWVTQDATAAGGPKFLQALMTI